MILKASGWCFLAMVTFMVSWFGLAGPVEAAQIRMINCTDQRVKMCNTEETDEEIMGPEGVKHFTCDARCAFRILECEGNKCGNCDHAEEAARLKGDYGKGDYRLVGLDRTNGDSGQYKASNLEKGNVCPAPYAPQLR
jgi:hypothetical protein